MEKVERAFAPALFLDIHADADHGRAAYTLAAEQGRLADGLVSGAAAVIEHVDLTRHEGLHPHVGALDVMPVVYLRRGPAWRCVRGGTGGGRTDRRRAGAARDPLRRAGHAARARGAQLAPQGGLAAAGGADRVAGRSSPTSVPPHAHPTAGVVLAAARPPLVAFNIELEDDDLEPAERIAAAGSASPAGGSRACGRSGCGWRAAAARRCRPTCTTTGSRRSAWSSRRCAARADIAEAELVGLAPSAAFQRFPADVPIRDFSPERHLLENALRSIS